MLAGVSYIHVCGWCCAYMCVWKGTGL